MASGAVVIRTEPRLQRALGGHLARGDALAVAFAYASEHRNRIMRMEHPIGYLFRLGQSKARTRNQAFFPWSFPDAIPDVETRPRTCAPLVVTGAVPSRVARARVRLDVSGDRRSAPHVGLHGGVSRELGTRTSARAARSCGLWVRSKTSWSISPRVAPRRSWHSR